jgi:hypothetical protein
VNKSTFSTDRKEEGVSNHNSVAKRHYKISHRHQLKACLGVWSRLLLKMFSFLNTLK